MDIDGSDVVQLRAAGQDGWRFQGHPEWHPSGDRIVMFGGAGVPQIWVTDRYGRNPLQITNREGRNLDPSYSADGRRITFVGCPQPVCYDEDHEIYSLDVGEQGDRPTGDAIRITNDRLRDHDPYESPTGDRIAWLTQMGTQGFGVWDIRITAVGAGGEPSGTARVLMNDGAITSLPKWTADGTAVITHRLEVGSMNFDLVRIDVATAAMTRLGASSPWADEYASP